MHVNTHLITDLLWRDHCHISSGASASFLCSTRRQLPCLLARIKKRNQTVRLIDGKVGNFFWKLESNDVKAEIEVL